MVERATTRAQRVLTGTLTTLPGLIAEHQIQSPALIIVGDVVKLAGTLAWFDGAGGWVKRRSPNAPGVVASRTVCGLCAWPRALC